MRLQQHLPAAEPGSDRHLEKLPHRLPSKVGVQKEPTIDWQPYNRELQPH
jgi:hypothetical protein